MMIKVLASGLFTTIQDRGRFGYRDIGVPISGAMDGMAADLANTILGNNRDCAVMEITLQGPVLEFQSRTLAVITGGIFPCSQNGNAVPMNKRVIFEKGTILSFGNVTEGARAYLAVVGGFMTDKVLGSRSYFEGITKEHLVQKGMVLSIPSEVQVFGNAVKHITKIDFSEKKLAAYEGPEYHLLPHPVKQVIEEGVFTIGSESNRMGFVLNSTSEITAKEIRTAPVQPGTVQLTPSGRLIVLMCDAQTTGGYARVLQLKEDAIHLLAQKKPGEEIQFMMCGYYSY